MSDRGDWLEQGAGRLPHVSWSLTTDAPLVAMQLARETGELLAADAAGGLYKIDRAGQLIHQTHGPAGIRALAWSDTGHGGVALVGEEKLYWFNRGLLPQGWLEHTEMTLGVAIEAYGRYAAVSLADSSTVIYDATRQRVRRFTSTIPLIALEFLVSRPAIVGVAEHGLLCCQAFSGEQEWKQTLWTSVGDLAVTGDGGTILLACYSQGIQSYDGSGKQVGSYQLDGTVSRIATSYRPDHLAAATQERQFFYLAANGQVEFQALLPDDACRVLCDPLGTGVVLGLAGGEILRLDWGA